MRSLYHASDGAAYQRFLGRWTAALSPIFADFAQLPAAGAVLDLGCGTGSLAMALAERGQQAVGCDIALPYLDFARRQPQARRIAFVAGDAGALPFAAGSFAAALAQLALNFTPDPAAALREMRRVVRPGGVVAGALIGGLFVGVVESLSSVFLGQSLGQIGIFVMFIVVLLLRPGGLLGERA